MGGRLYKALWRASLLVLVAVLCDSDGGRGAGVRDWMGGGSVALVVVVVLAVVAGVEVPRNRWYSFRRYSNSERDKRPSLSASYLSEEAERA